MTVRPTNQGWPKFSDVVSENALPMVGASAREDGQTVVSNVDAELTKLFEDRNVLLTGGVIGYNTAGNLLTFTDALSLELNSKAAGGSPTVIQIVAAAASYNFTSDGAMLYAVIDRAGGASSPITNSGPDSFSYDLTSSSARTGQTFTSGASASAIQSIDVRLSNAGSSETNLVYIDIWATDGNVPIGIPIATSTGRAKNSLTTTLGLNTFTFSIPVNLTASTVYAFSVRVDGAFSDNLQIKGNIDSYAGGRLIVSSSSGSSWSYAGTDISGFSINFGGSTTIVSDAATLPAVNSANQEVYLIAKRRDLGSVKKIYFRNGFTIANGQTSSMGSQDDFTDTSFSVVDATDNTKQFKLDVNGDTNTSTTLATTQTSNITLTLPGTTDTLVGRNTTDTLKNKRLDNASVRKDVDGSGAASQLRFYNEPGTAYTAIEAGAGLGSNYTLKLPNTVGNPGTDYLLLNNGSGTTSWKRVSETSDGSAVVARNSDGDIEVAKVTATSGVINANSTTDAFKITQQGTGNAFVVEDVASDLKPFIIDQYGNIKIGGLIEAGGPNAYIQDYASGYNTTHTPTTPYEIARFTFGGDSRNMVIVGEIRGVGSTSMGVSRFVLNCRSNVLPSKSFALTEETLNLGLNVNVKVYHDATTGLVVIGYTGDAQLFHIGWSLKLQKRSDYENLTQVESLTALNTAGLTEVSSAVTTTYSTTSNQLVKSLFYNLASVSISSNTFALSSGAMVQDITSGTGPLNTITGGSDGKIILVRNSTGAELIVANNSGAGGFYTGTGDDITIQDKATLTLRYDSTASRWNVIGGTGSGTGGTTDKVTQVAHGFSVGDVLYIDLGSMLYRRATADTSETAEVVGVVSKVTNADVFELTLSGEVKNLTGSAYIENTLPTVGSVAFLSPLAQTTRDAGLTNNNPITLLDSATTAFAQEFIAEGSNVISISTVSLARIVAGTATLVGEIWTKNGSNLPGSLLYTSTNTVAISSLDAYISNSVNYTSVAFNFSNVSVTPNTSYMFVVRYSSYTSGKVQVLTTGGSYTLRLSPTTTYPTFSSSTPSFRTSLAINFLAEGKLTTTEPSVIGQVSLPVGVVSGIGTLYVAPKRGAVIGSVNARTELELTNNSLTNVYTAPAGMEAGELQGWIYIDATTNYRFYVTAQFAKNGDNTNWNIAYQTAGDTPPAGFSMAISSGGVISVTLPNLAGYVSSKINYNINGPAVGVTFPLNVASTNVTFTDIQAATTGGLTFKQSNGTTAGSMSDDGRWTLGPTGAAAFTTLGGSGNLANGVVQIASNACLVGAGATDARSDSTRAGGAIIINAPASDANCIQFYANQDNDGADIDADLVGAVNSIGQWTLGPSNQSGFNMVSGSTAIANGVVQISANACMAVAGAVDSRSDSTRAGGAVVLAATASSSSTPIKFYANQSADGVDEEADLVGSVTGFGAWSFGINGGTTAAGHTFYNRSFNIVFGTASTSGYNFTILGDNSYARLYTDSLNRPIAIHRPGNATTGVYLNASDVWTSTSDIRAKTNIADIKVGLDAILKLRPIEFDFIENQTTGSQVYGFSAQEVLQIIPKMVTVPEDSEQFMQLGQTMLIPVLVKAIQELKTELDSVKAELNQLKNS